MAIIPNTLLYFPDARTTDLPTGAHAGGFLGGANRHQTNVLTVTIEETGSRTFLSVILEARFADRFTVANEITDVRMGSKVGAAAFIDVDRTFTQANTGDHSREVWHIDVTDNFTTNFGAGTSQTFQAAIEVLTTSASNIGATIYFRLLVTYSFDDAVGTRRTKTVPIPIQSHHQAPGTTQVEIGTTGGTSNAPVNQIPALDTYLDETNKTYQNTAVEWMGQRGSAASDTTPFVQIDAVAEVAQGVIGQALVTAGPCTGLFNYSTATFATNAAHAFKMRTDVAGALVCVGAVLWVTYSYDANSARGTFVTMSPLTNAFADGAGPKGTISPTDNVQADAWVGVANVDVFEAGTITLKQSAAVLLHDDVSGGTVTSWAGAQTPRQWSGVTNGGFLHYLIHRTDHSSGWTIARGNNQLFVRMYNSLSFRHLVDGFAIVVYGADAPPGGVARGGRCLTFFNAAYGNTPATAVNVPASGGGQRPVTIAAPWKISALWALVWARGNGIGGNSCQLMHEVRAGEGVGEGWTISEHHSNTGFNELGCRETVHSFFRRYNPDSIRTDRLAVNTARRQMLMASSTVMAAIMTNVQVFSATYIVSGAVTISGVAAPDGGAVYVYEWSAALGTTKQQLSTTISGGAGGFTCQVFDPTKQYVAYYEVGANAGASLPALPTTVASSSHNVAIGASAAPTPPTLSNLTPTPGTPVFPDTPIQFDITDVDGFAIIIPMIVLDPFAVPEPVGRGVLDADFAFEGLYQTSTRTAITNGFRYVLRRRGGWTAAPTLRLWAVDAKGAVWIGP